MESAEWRSNGGFSGCGNRGLEEGGGEGELKRSSHYYFTCIQKWRIEIDCSGRRIASLIEMIYGEGKSDIG